MTIRPVGMTLERAMEIASAALPTEPRYATNPVTRTRPRRGRMPGDRERRIRELHAGGATDSDLAGVLAVTVPYAAELRRILGLLPNEPATGGFGPLTQCKRGHEFTPENTMMSEGRRACRECKRIRGRRYEATTRKYRQRDIPMKTTNQKADNA